MLILFSVYFSKQSFLGEHLFHPFVPFEWEGFKNLFRARANKNRVKRNTSLDLVDDTMKGKNNA